MRRRLAHVALLAAVATGLSGCSYNKFTTQEEAIKQQFAEVQNQLQRRNDLIPNLVETVKGYAAHEDKVFTDIAESRSRLAGAKTPEETLQAANQQSSALGRLSGTENRLSVARMRYNETVQQYNTQRRKFPSNVTAKMFGFKEYPYWEVPPEAKVAPKVNFGR